MRIYLRYSASIERVLGYIRSRGVARGEMPRAPNHRESESPNSVASTSIQYICSRKNLLVFLS